MAPGRRKGRATAAVSRLQWKIGDLVLAKVKGFPPWPAVISDPQKWGYSSDRRKLFVYFFGTKQIAFCNHADVEAFTEEKRRLLLGKRHGKGVDFIRAVDEIIENFERLTKHTVDEDGKDFQKESFSTSNGASETLFSRQSNDSDSLEEIPATPMEDDLDIVDRLRNIPMTSNALAKRSRHLSHSSCTQKRSLSHQRSRSKIGIEDENDGNNLISEEMADDCSKRKCSEQCVMESNCNGESVAKNPSEDYATDRGFEAQMNFVVHKKKRKPSRKPSDQETEKARYQPFSMGSSYNPKDRLVQKDSDEHLPLVKRARVRMGNILDEKGVDESVGKSENGILNCARNLSSSSNETLRSGFNGSLPADDQTSTAMHWKDRNCPSRGNAIDMEAALPPSKRLSRALEAMSVNATGSNDGPLEASTLISNADTCFISSPDMNPKPSGRNSPTVEAKLDDLTATTGLNDRNNRPSFPKVDDSVDENVVDSAALNATESLVSPCDDEHGIDLLDLTVRSYFNTSSNRPGFSSDSNSKGPFSEADYPPKNDHPKSVIDEKISEKLSPIPFDGQIDESGQLMGITKMQSDNPSDQNEKIVASQAEGPFSQADYPPKNDHEILVIDEKISEKLSPKNSTGDKSPNSIQQIDESAQLMGITKMQSYNSSDQNEKIVASQDDYPPKNDHEISVIDEKISEKLSPKNSTGDKSPNSIQQIDESGQSMGITKMQSDNPSDQNEKIPHPSSTLNEATAARKSFESLVSTLSRTKESIGRATRVALECMKHGVAGEVVQILVHDLETTVDLNRKLDLLFLVDSIAQRSRLHKDFSGDSYPCLFQPVLSRLLLAAAPPGNNKCDNRRQCLKVLKLWHDRRILPESVLQSHIQELESTRDASFPPRAERALGDPIREMEGMLVDEYGSNANFQIPTASKSRRVEGEEEGSADVEMEDGELEMEDEKSFETVTPVHDSKTCKEVETRADSFSDKHRLILEDVDGELEMEDVSPQCPNGEIFPYEPGRPPLPADKPPSPPPLPSSPPPGAPLCRPVLSLIPPSAAPPNHADDLASHPFPARNNVQYSRLPNGGPQMQLSSPCHYQRSYGYHLSTSNAPPMRNSKGYHLQPPPPPSMAKSSHDQAEKHHPPRYWRERNHSSPYHRRPQFPNQAQGGSHSFSNGYSRRPIHSEMSERCSRFSPTARSGLLPHCGPRAQVSSVRNGWSNAPRGSSYRFPVTSSRPPLENKASRVAGAPDYWRPR